MVAMGIITCEMLELEFAHLLTRDRQVVEVAVVDTPAAQAFITALESENSLHVRRIAHPSSLRPEPGPDIHVIAQVLDYRLHRNKKEQLRIIKNTTMTMRRYIDGLVLGYGMCGGLLTDVEVAGHLDIPVFRPNEDGRPTDDCVGMILGGRQRYYAEQCKIAGTFFMTPGWTRHWAGMLTEDIDQQTLKRLFSNYSRALIVETPVLYRGTMMKNIQPFVSMLDLKCELTTGTMRLLEKMWHAAKASITTLKPACGPTT